MNIPYFNVFLYLNLDMLKNIWDFSEHKPVFLDIFIIALGLFIVLYQLYVRLLNYPSRFCKKVEKDAFFITKTKIKLQYISHLIELLPILGILGTVWGLAEALNHLSIQGNADISEISKNIAPALSTSFFGLLFMAINLFVYNFLHSHLSELIAWCQQNILSTKSSQSPAKPKSVPNPVEKSESSES